MKIINFPFIIILTFVILSCNKAKKDCEINSIIIESRRSYRDKEVLKVTNKRIISKIIALKNKGIPMYDNNIVKNNFGSIEIYHYCNRSKVNILDLIYTKFDGVIICSGPDKYFKSNKLKNYIEGLMESKTR